MEELMELLKIEEKAKKYPLHAFRVRSGLYYIATTWGELYFLELRTLYLRLDGKPTYEWWIGPERDPGANQYATKRAALADFIEFVIDSHIDRFGHAPKVRR